MTSTIQAPPSNRNRLVVFGALGVVVLLAAFVLPRVLFGGGGGDELGPPPEPGATSGATTTTTAPPAGLTSPVLPEAFSTKNPFASLVPTTPAATATGTGAVATDGTTAGTGATGATSDVPAAGTGTEPDRASARFSLVDVYEGSNGAAVATVEVDGSSYTVAEGETFEGYTVVSLSASTRSGTFSSPSGGGTFTATTGESRLK